MYKAKEIHGSGLKWLRRQYYEIKLHNGNEMKHYGGE